jgi:dTDP-4-dehydrorhamnose reductase
MRKNSIWIAGAAGTLGPALVKLLKENTDYMIISTDMDVDITDMDAVRKAIDVYRPNIIINCASLSNVEYCENHMVEAFKVNALGARNLATASRKINAKIIQLSTDDVYDAKKAGHLIEFDTPEPKTVYGKSKLAGECYVRELNPKHLIIRSSWVYGGKNDFFTHVLDHGKRGESFEVPLDQVSTPTSAYELAKFLSVLLDREEYGTFHASCEGICSRHEFAKTILQLAGYDPELAVGTFASNADDTSSTVLENLMMKMTGLYEMPEWQDALEAYIKNTKETR